MGTFHHWWFESIMLLEWPWNLRGVGRTCIRVYWVVCISVCDCHWLSHSSYVNFSSITRLYVRTDSVNTFIAFLKHYSKKGKKHFVGKTISLPFILILTRLTQCYNSILPLRQPLLEIRQTPRHQHGKGTPAFFWQFFVVTVWKSKKLDQEGSERSWRPILLP